MRLLLLLLPAAWAAPLTLKAPGGYALEVDNLGLSTSLIIAAWLISRGLAQLSTWTPSVRVIHVHPDKETL